MWTFLIPTASVYSCWEIYTLQYFKGVAWNNKQKTLEKQDKDY